MQAFKKVMNQEEQRAYGELQQLADRFGYVVHVKMRVADVVPINNSGVSKELFSYALKSHFDFVVCDTDQNPMFAVEFDGPSHRTTVQRGRDALKDALCKQFELPLLRINSNHLFARYNKATLLQWIISAWELQKSFDEAQEKGHIPIDEPFDPIMLRHPGKTLEETHPHWLSLKPRLNFKTLHEQGRIPSRHTSQFVFTDVADTYHGIEWIDATERSVVCVESAMRAQLFPMYLGDLFSELLTVLLHEKLQSFLTAGSGDDAPRKVEDRLAEWKKKYNYAFCHSGPSLVKASLTLVGDRFV